LAETERVDGAPTQSVAALLEILGRRRRRV